VTLIEKSFSFEDYSVNLRATDIKRVLISTCRTCFPQSLVVGDELIKIFLASYDSEATFNRVDVKQGVCKRKGSTVDVIMAV
jgi:hypothetical protein